MKKWILLSILILCGCNSTREYTTRCQFTVPVDKPIDKSSVTVEVKINGKY